MVNIFSLGESSQEPCDFSRGRFRAGFNNPHVHKVAYPFSTALIHDGSLNLEGATGSVNDTMRFQNKLNAKIKEYVLSHSKLTEKEYKKLDRVEAWLTAEDMLRYGLIDEIIGG